MSQFRALARAYRLPDVPEPGPSPTDHDAAEAEAMSAHYAAPVGALLPSPDPLTEGLLAGFRQHCTTPSPGARPPSRPGPDNHSQ